MAEEQAAGNAAKGGFDFLKQKVGPLPLGVWMVAALGIWWYMQRGNTGTGQQTDPAGNVGTINPNTGFVTGSPEDQAALRGINSSAGADTSSSNTSGSTVAGSYADNNAWAQAAINYLVARGVDATQANEAIQQFLASQPLTSAQQADVNLAIQGLGTGPPTLPGPVGTAPTPVVTPPSTTTPKPTPPKKTTIYASNPATGLKVLGHSKNYVRLSWNRVTNASGYSVAYGKAGGPGIKSIPVGNTPSATIGDLQPGTRYWFHVHATPEKSGAPFATIFDTTSR